MEAMERRYRCGTAREERERGLIQRDMAAGVTNQTLQGLVNNETHIDIWLDVAESTSFI
jgi:hypothetical protein